MRRYLSMLLAIVLALSVSLAAVAADGVFKGQGAGMMGPIEVEVTVEGGAIAKVEVLSHSETPGISDPALSGVVDAIVKANSAEVDSVAGATMTSKGIKEAVANALKGTGDEGAQEGFKLAFEPDIVIVGAGMGGMVTAVKAAELGAHVLLLEQSPRMGGSALFAGGSISGAGYNIQKEAGIEDSPEQFYADFVRLGGEENMNQEIAQVHAHRSGPAIDWLESYVKVDFGDRHVDSGSYEKMYPNRVTYALGMSPSGGAKGFLEALGKKIDQGIADGLIQVEVNTLVTDIILEGDTVKGVKIGDREITAPSTVIATGGYGYNESWIKEYNYTNVTSSNPNTAIGSGYDFARTAGAAFDNMDFMACYGGSVPVSGFAHSLSAVTGYPGCIWVDKHGNRMVDEVTADSKVKSDTWSAKAEDNIVYILVSEGMLNREVPLFRGAMGAPPLANNGWDQFDELVKEGKYVIKADTIAELAEKIGADKLPATIEKYNADAAAGADSAFGRKDNLVAFNEGPFYAIYTVPFVLMSSGGPRINGNGEMLREDGTVVKGAYLVGEIIGSANVGGKTTIGGIGHGLVTTWGIIAAENGYARAQELGKK
ncbi:MAG: FAD-binding protein [Clostridiales bacterium]|nr:FAD-binding protein [Clostridiales bacterium]